MTKLHLLTDTDVAILREVVNDYRRRPKNTAQYETEVDASVSQFYKTPVGGIAAATEASGVYSFTGAECVLYDCYMDGSTLKAAPHVPEIKRIVYNSTTMTIAGSSLIQTKTVGGRFLFVDVGSCGA